jgi:hypothetical protein
MPSTYANNLRLENIANGEQSGSWGDTTNKNICSLLVDSITAVTTISITGSGNYILTANAGTTDEARTAVLRFTGLRSTDCYVTAPAVAKTYIIDNFTDEPLGSKNIIMRTTAGAGATVPFGKYTVYCDGLDFFVQTGFAAGGVINGNAATTGNFIAGNNLTALGTTTLATALTGALVGTAGVVSAVAPGTAGNILSSTGTAWASTANAPAFASGTRIGFQQTAAPTGWTKDTTAAINDSILRFVTGSVTPSGGSVAFSTWAAQTASGGYTLQIADIPAHTHGYPETTTSGAAGASSGRPVSNFVTVQTQSTGGSGSHSHSLTQGLKFYDFIIASKD